MGSNEAGPDRDQGAPPADSPNPEHTRHPVATVGSATDLVQAPKTGVARQEAGSQALAAQVEAHTKASFFLARQFPRSWPDVRLRLLDAFKRPILAEGARYSKPVGDKDVTGLSIRFSEEAFRVMGNIDLQTILVSDDDDKRVYVIRGTDMETLATQTVAVIVTKQIERSSKKADSIVLGQRTNSRGKPTYILKATSEDDYRAKEQALLQKARRDVIQFLVPGDIKEECEQQIIATLSDRDTKDPQAAINRLTEAFFSFGVTVAELEKYLGHPVRTVNAAERQRCREILTALKDGETTWADIMEHRLAVNTGADEKVGEKAPAAAKSATANITDAVKGKTSKTTGIPERIQKLIDNENVPQALSDEDKEELRQFRADNAALFPTK